MSDLLVCATCGCPIGWRHGHIVRPVTYQAWIDGDRDWDDEWLLPVVLAIGFIAVLVVVWLS